MLVDERTATERLTKPAGEPEASGWFAARQPGVIRFLGERLGEGSDAFGVAFEACWRLAGVFEERDGVHPPRVDYDTVVAFEQRVRDEALKPAVVADGFARRQAHLCAWIASYLGDPPAPLSEGEHEIAGTSIAAFLYAIDHATSGDPRR